MHLIGHALFASAERARRLLRFGGDIRGLALLEFALALPLVLAMGGYGVEIAHLALTNLRISQIALELADNASRVGVTNGLSVEQLREADINDILQAARLVGGGLGLTTYGRVTISSLENVQQSYDTAPLQRIHWQRCIGKRSGTGYDSSYGTTSPTAASDATVANAGTAAPSGMGDTGAMVTAPPASGVIFVEVNYDYQPLFGTLFVKTAKLHYVASFVVRDKRDFSQIFNPAPAATASTCNLYNS
jgi:Flp pilus assembly protein TadG